MYEAVTPTTTLSLRSEMNSSTWKQSLRCIFQLAIMKSKFVLKVSVHIRKIPVFMWNKNNWATSGLKSKFPHYNFVKQEVSHPTSRLKPKYIHRTWHSHLSTFPGQVDSRDTSCSSDQVDKKSTWCLRIVACTSLSHHQVLNWTDENDRTCWTLEAKSEVYDSMCDITHQH